MTGYKLAARITHHRGKWASRLNSKLLDCSPSGSSIDSTFKSFVCLVYGQENS